MNKTALKGILLAGLLGTHQAHASTGTTNCVTTWFNNHKNIVIPTLMISGFLTVVYGMKRYQEYKDNQKPFEQLLQEAKELVTTIEKSIFYTDASVINFSASPLLTAKEKITLSYAGHQFPFLEYYTDINFLIGKVSAKLNALKHKHTVAHQLLWIDYPEITALNKYLVRLKKLAATVFFHPQYSKEITLQEHDECLNAPCSL